MVSTFLNPFAARPGAEAPPLAAAPDGRALTLVFADDFQVFQPWNDRGGVWRATLGDGLLFSREREDPALRSESADASAPGVAGLDPFSIDRGVLEITAQPTPANAMTAVEDYPYVSGLISTQPSFAQTYGYFEMRAELPRGKGLWPAFWMLPKDDSWPPEIDIVESIGDPSRVYMTAHSKHGKSASVEARVTPNAFHTFAVSWDPAAADLVHRRRRGRARGDAAGYAQADVHARQFGGWWELVRRAGCIDALSGQADDRLHPCL